MKKILLLLVGNVMFAQSIPEPKEVNIAPPAKVTHLNIYQNELKEAIQPFLDCEKYGLGIIRYYPTGDEISTGASFHIYNPAKKTIKYIWITVAGVNSVGDLVTRGKKTYHTLKGIGPVEQYETGSWSFDYVWLTDVVETMKISSIKIQYMDNTFRTIKYNENMYIGQDAYERFVTAMYNKDKKEQEEERIINKVSADDKNVFEFVDFIPEFPGGLAAFRSKIRSSIETDQSGVFDISFIVEKDGSMSNVKISGSNSKLNEDAVKSISQIKILWTPAKKDNVSVRYKNNYLITID